MCTKAELAKRSLSAGNAVMTRLWMHVKVILILIVTIIVIIINLLV